MTIAELLAATGLTANDLVPIWDAEAAQNVEPTQKVTAAQLAAAVKVLASLVNTTDMNAAIAQSTAISTITFTPASGVSSNLFVRKSGNVVSINGYLTATNAFSTSEFILGNLPAGVRPSANVRCLAGVSSVAYAPGDIAYLLVATSGNLGITAKTGNSYKVCYFNVTYIAEA